MKVVFLDVDGVLNSVEGFSTTIEPTLVEQLNAIVRASGASIVVSSSWRSVGLRRMRELLRAAGFVGRVTGVTPIIGGVPRGLEIQAWLDRCRWTVSHFVILDDTDDMAHLRCRLINTDPRAGLTADDVSAALAVLALPVDAPSPGVNGTAGVTTAAHYAQTSVIAADTEFTVTVVETEVTVSTADASSTVVLMTETVELRTDDHAAGLPTTVP